jgi:sterol desaturase/sphingolipid hydroxylase (fatty acid hydroxylase superfamily)
MDVVVQAITMAVLLAAAPVGAWYTNRHPAVRNDTWGGALGFFLSWIGFLLAVAYCAWRARRPAPQPAGDSQLG